MLTPFKRGPVWWVRGRIEYNGRPLTGYLRQSTGASTEAGARDWIAAEESRVIRRAVLGEARQLTFADAVLLYPAKPAEAKFLMRVLPALGPRAVAAITPAEVRALAPELYPHAATDTWRRQVLTPVSAVINHAHQLGRCPPIRIRGFSAQDRIDQDKRRGRQSRPERPAGSWPWIRAVQPYCNIWVAAALEFMFETGARIGQTIAVTPSDLDLAACRVWLQPQKGHAGQWTPISAGLAATLSTLKPRRPRRMDGRRHPRLVFGYANRTGFTSALRRACKAAKQPYLTPHEAGRHGFYTELRVRQGLDPITVAAAGRWSDPTLPDRRYAHAESGTADLRERIRTARGG